jgi:hypothetical protein
VWLKLNNQQHQLVQAGITIKHALLPGNSVRKCLHDEGVNATPFLSAARQHQSNDEAAVSEGSPEGLLAYSAVNQLTATARVTDRLGQPTVIEVIEHFVHHGMAAATHLPDATAVWPEFRQEIPDSHPGCGTTSSCVR